MIRTSGRIQLLDAHTVNQIAAGEVVERPASVVKELVENAIDAGAGRIVVELESSGKRRIHVSDDGCGMSPKDAVLALQRHATSKIRSVDDLNEVRSLGFRGEALPSIASVSRFTLSTGVADGRRTVVRVEGGRVSDPAAGSGPRGTDVTVEDLFFNTPARLKFLKSDATELGALMDVLSKYAIVRPNIAFRVTHGGQAALTTDGSGDMLQAIAAVWGRDIARGLAEVDLETAGIRVRGFVSPPHLTKPTRALQYLFVNGRPVRTRTLTASLDQAYRSLTPERRFPVVALMIDVAPALVDVNVSPTKSEVKFQNEGVAFDALRHAVKSALMEHGMIPSLDAVRSANEALAAVESSASRTLWAPGFDIQARSGPVDFRERIQPGAVAASIDAQSPIAPLSQTGETWPLALADALAAPAEMRPSDESVFRSGAERFPFADLLDGLRILGQVHNTFIVAENRKGIVVVDQHVAHERVLYEYLCGVRGNTAIDIQHLLTPETLTLDKRSAVMLRERIDEIRAVGFDLEPFGGDSFVVRSVPAATRGRSAIKVLRDLIDELVEGAVARKLSPTREQIWITTACKMAIKAGDPLSLPEMEKLIVDLASTENPYLCPHGRPITVTLSIEDLMRRFKRT